MHSCPVTRMAIGGDTGEAGDIGISFATEEAIAMVAQRQSFMGRYLNRLGNDGSPGEEITHQYHTW